MLHSIDQMLGATVATKDGALGRLEDVYYDDRFWTVRYLVVSSLADEGQARLVSPVLVENLSDEPGRIHLALDREQVLEAPDISQERPVSLQAERRYHDYYGWPYYWQGPYAWGSMWTVPTPTAAGLPTETVAPPPSRGGAEEVAGDAGAGETTAPSSDSADEPRHHLRSATETMGYHLQSLNGEIGHVEDFVIGDDTWHITAMVVNTRNWWFGKKVALPAEDFTRIDWGARLFFVDETREQIKAAREFDPSELPREE
jgi:uncharacterized protein YrrD